MKRDYGIDLLRILAALYMVILHVLGQGGVLASGLDRSHYFLAWFMETFAFCAVDCFGLISGYVGYRKDNRELKVSRYVSLWLQVVYYGLLITLIYSFLLPGQVGLTKYIKAALPVTLNLHWYFTAYTGLFFVMPLINIVVQKTDNQPLKKYAFLCMLLFSTFASISSIFQDDVFSLRGGYSFVWLVILYFIGAVIKKTGLFAETKNSIILVLVIIITLLSVMWNTYVSCVPFVGKYIQAINLISYISPTILSIAIAHLSFFTKAKLPDWVIKLVRFAAPGTFAIYLLNTQYYVWNYYLFKRFESLSTAPLYMSPVTVIAFSVIVVFVSVTIDRFRQILFSKIKVYLFARKVETLFNVAICAITNDKKNGD